MTDEIKKGVADAGGAAFIPDAPAVRAKSSGKLKVRRIGNSLGVVLPKDVLAKLGAEEGAELTVVQTPNGVTLSMFDAEVAEQVEIGLDIMKRYRNALRELAK